MPIPCHSPETVLSGAPASVILVPHTVEPWQGPWINYWRVYYTGVKLLEEESVWLRLSLPWRTSPCSWSFSPGEGEHLISSRPPGCVQLTSPPPRWTVMDPELRTHSGLLDPGECGRKRWYIGVKWGLAPAGKTLGISLTFFEAWSPYLKIGNKENLPHRLLWEWI